MVQNSTANQAMLHDALLNNSVKEIHAAVKAGADVNLPINEKRPLFIAACSYGYESVKCLLELGARCDVESNLEFAELRLGEVTIDARTYVLLAAYGAKNFKHTRSILLEEGLLVHLDCEAILLIIKKFPAFAAEINKWPSMMEFLIDNDDGSQAYSELIQHILAAGKAL
jgi:hypothetical protein